MFKVYFLKYTKMAKNIVVENIHNHICANMFFKMYLKYRWYFLLRPIYTVWKCNKVTDIYIVLDPKKKKKNLKNSENICFCVHVSTIA